MRGKFRDATLRYTDNWPKSTTSKANCCSPASMPPAGPHLRRRPARGARRDCRYRQAEELTHGEQGRRADRGFPLHRNQPGRRRIDHFTEEMRAEVAANSTSSSSLPLRLPQSRSTAAIASTATASPWITICRRWPVRGNLPFRRPSRSARHPRHAARFLTVDVRRPATAISQYRQRTAKSPRCAASSITRVRPSGGQREMGLQRAGQEERGESGRHQPDRPLGPARALQQAITTDAGLQLRTQAAAEPAARGAAKLKRWRYGDKHNDRISINLSCVHLQLVRRRRHAGGVSRAACWRSAMSA